MGRPREGLALVTTVTVWQTAGGYEVRCDEHGRLELPPTPDLQLAEHAAMAHAIDTHPGFIARSDPAA